ncbi:diguanylate cyclase (GGDEF)-like protein [Motilibacter peucedani]|uniref:Diguanylate cyclase (GGDEF)-like protein n=1 Tax=Motilibacter peucedani TaxID=598650 RepID=A0A420XRI7_9ACTN|nr:GGDEF domain-containing protein [Motilibacter peucedani]RKS77417.1 diguanylate cyclase (GGDEF)-like protein [Motilibacter peucedani]
MTDDATPPAWAARSTLLVWLLIGAMAALAALLAEPAGLDTRFSVPSTAAFVLLPVFALAEILVIHLPAERSSHSHTLREVPAIAGLSLLAPGEYFAVCTLGAGAALLLWSHQRGRKLAFNIALYAVEATLGLVVFHAVLGASAPAQPRGWLAATTAVLVTDLVTAMAVTAVISLSDGSYDGEVMREALRSGVPAALVNTCLALLVVVLVDVRPEALPLLGAALAMLVVGYRAFVTLGTGYSRLQLLYSFVEIASTTRERGPEAAHTLLREAATLMRADRATLVLLPQTPGVDADGVRLDLDGGTMTRTQELLRPDGGDDWWRAALAGRTVLRSAPGRRRPSATLPEGPRDGLAVPLRSDGALVGALIVTDRSFEEQTFGREDLRLFETLAAHAVVSLSKSRLMDDLRTFAAQREHEALHDPLTGLANRRSLLEGVTAQLTDGRGGALLVIDLNDFKDVNDTLGHSAGDALLEVVAQRLAASTNGTVARLGGDEFAALLPGAGAEEALGVAERLVHVISQPVPLEGLTLSTGLSIGIAVLGLHGEQADELLAHADAAMYAAKAGATRVSVYRPEDSGATHRRLVLAGDLPRAIEHHRFEVWFQPQAESDTGRVTSAEALLRWDHPEFGFVPPPEIISIAERTGTIRALTDAVISDALHQRATWAAAGHLLDIAVNITPADLRDADLPAAVARMLAETGTPPAALTLEITESGVMTDPERCLAVLDALAALGVRLSVDDFGTGYSSLAYLERLPVNEVKIDRSFVQRLELSEHDATVIRATVALAHDLGLHVVAEGIETRVGWERVATLGCEQIQGYHLARPMPGSKTLEWLAADTGERAHERAAAAHL